MAIKKESSDKFYQKMRCLSARRGFPLKAMFEVTYRCNFQCIHCYVVRDKEKKELPTGEVKAVLDELRSNGCFHIGFTGGEPLMREDIFEILDYAKSGGFRISLLTNGFLINKKIAGRIASLGTSLNRVDISILGANKETFESITGKKGSFAKAMCSMRLLKDAGADVQIKSVLMKPNQHEFVKIRNLSKKFKTMFRYSSTINPKINGDKTPLEYQVKPEDAYRINRSLSSSKNIINELSGKEWSTENIGRKSLFRCGAGRSEIIISPYGEMRLCMEIPYPQYNILKGDFRKGWKKMQEFVADIRLPRDYICGKCVLASFCQWCPARGFLLSGRLTGCSRQDRDAALVEAEHSPLWSKIEPIWDRQKRRFNTQ